MGKGDKKSSKGKRWKGSYGVNRNKKAIKARLKRSSAKKPESVVAESAPAKPRRTIKKKAEA
ncbi:MAG TPA: 30S ribosomal protein THX [Chryseosolibacter sp.]|nr:30S ribosomal protein THX [Chryseosolibacter sp.]